MDYSFLFFFSQFFSSIFHFNKTKTTDYNSFAINDMELEKEDKERQDYEEEYMTRLVMSKKDKHRRRRALEGRDGGVDNLRSNGMHELEGVCFSKNVCF